jgi:hypothetical protein
MHGVYIVGGKIIKIKCRGRIGFNIRIHNIPLIKAMVRRPIACPSSCMMDVLTTPGFK